ncbi:DUF692 domain-containing protein [Hugenholtzia roseola]|uniref:DUF692 domain-containing protein n=1 Tax=Hugenholtzia roseola TaxID=1002 RepID=UPI000422F700|nr:DUF692 domain-containing protein [Hugenholtzia roseola]
MKVKTDFQNQIPFLGVGMGFRTPFLPALWHHKKEVDFLEIVADHYLEAKGQKKEELDFLKDNFILIPHALDTSLGSSEGLFEPYIEKLARLIDYLNPPYWSEHLAFTRAAGVGIGHLTPTTFSTEMLDIFTKNIEKVKSYIKKPLILENITYAFRLPDSDLEEADFISQLAQRADVGLLLDATNLYINSVNHNFSYMDFLAKIPKEKIIQLHFVGGQAQGEWLIDSHSSKTPPQILKVIEEIVKLAPHLKGAILERDENFPPFSEIKEEMATVRALFEKHKNSEK